MILPKAVNLLRIVLKFMLLYLFKILNDFSFFLVLLFFSSNYILISSLRGPI